MRIRTIDFEASCLPRHGRSFPIEVGIAGAGGSRSWLIRPHDSWRGWDWVAEAEALHGLSLAQVKAEGLPADVVYRQLMASLDGCRVVADSVIDQYWLQTLAEAAGCVTVCQIDHVSMLLDEHGVDEQSICAAVAFADARHPVRHRAEWDAQWLASLLDHVSGQEGVCPAVQEHPSGLMAIGNNL